MQPSASKKRLILMLPKTGVSIVLDCNQYNQQQQGTNDVDKKLDF
jgi:penicillin-binding protein 1A